MVALAVAAIVKAAAKAANKKKMPRNHAAFSLCFFQQYYIYWEVVTIPAHPDAATEGAERVAVVFAAVLFQELLVVYLGVLELVG